MITPHRILKGIKWTGLSSILRSFFQVLQYAVLARFLPAEAFGIMAMAMFVIGFSNIFIDMGLTSAILHKKSISTQEFSSIYWLNISLSLILFGIVYIFTPTISEFYNEPLLIDIVPILALNLIVISLGIQHRTMMEKRLRFNEIAFIDILSAFIGLVISIFFVLKDFGIYSLIYATLISSIVQNASYFILNIRTNSVSFFFKLNLIKGMLRIGGYQFGSTFLQFFSKEVDVLIIGKLLGTESLGIYSLSKQLITKVSGVINPTVTKVFVPVFASMQDNENQLRSNYFKMIYYLSSINVLIYLVFAVLSKEILTVFYGPTYSSGYIVLSFLGIAYCVKSISNPIGSVLIAKGRTDIAFKWSLIQVFTNTILIIFASQFSIEHVAVMIALLSYIVVIPQWQFAVKPSINASLKDYLGQFLKINVIFVITSLAFLFVDYFIHVNLNLYLAIGLKFSLLLIITLLSVYMFDRRRLLDIKKIKLLKI